MHKILIYRRKDELAPTGGPKGYLFNLLFGLNHLNTKKLQIDFLPSVAHGANSDKKKRIKKMMPKFLLRFFKSLSHGKTISRIVNKSLTSPVDINQYDLIHFHETCSILAPQTIRQDIHSLMVFSCYKYMQL